MRAAICAIMIPPPRSFNYLNTIILKCLKVTDSKFRFSKNNDNYGRITIILVHVVFFSIQNTALIWQGPYNMNKRGLR